LCEGGSDHCPAMKGIEDPRPPSADGGGVHGSDHCPAMKGIEDIRTPHASERRTRKRPLPRNEGD